MTTTAKKAPRRAKPAKRAPKRPDAEAGLKPFSVVYGKYLFWLTPEAKGFSVTCQNVPGVNAQGDTFEDALAHAVSMAEFVAECRAEIFRDSQP